VVRTSTFEGESPTGLSFRGGGYISYTSLLAMGFRAWWNIRTKEEGLEVVVDMRKQACRMHRARSVRNLGGTVKSLA
jgi:hypothetical protein